MEDGEVDRDNLATPSYVRMVPEIRVAMTLAMSFCKKQL